MVKEDNVQLFTSIEFKIKDRTLDDRRTPILSTNNSQQS